VNDWYSASDSPELVEFGPVRGVGVTGLGEPAGTEHMAAIHTLYAVAAPLLADALPALEGRWWVEDDRPPLTVPRSQWRWHLFLRLPESVEPARVDEARQATGLNSAARVQLVVQPEHASSHGRLPHVIRWCGRGRRAGVPGPLRRSCRSSMGRG
jgi:hypothetical protein